jgi:hypothetical protein
VLVAQYRIPDYNVMTLRSRECLMRPYITDATVACGLFLATATHAQTFNEIFVDNTNYPATIDLYDFNRDGNLDILAFDYQIVTGVRGNPTTMYQLTGNGDGTFTTLDTKYFTALFNHRVADFNSDGYLDLLIGDLAYPGTGNGSFSNQAISTGLPACEPVIEDFNNDGLSDLICYSNAGYPGFEPFTYINQNGFQFKRTDPLPAIREKRSNRTLIVGDINGDGLSDLVSVDSLYDTNYFPLGHVIRASIATSTGFEDTFSFETDELMDPNNRFATNGVTDIQLSDLNGDGNLDLLCLLAGFRNTPDAALVVYPGDGAGGFNTTRIYTRIGNTLTPSGKAGASGREYLHVTDMNDDGHKDVVLSLGDHGISNPQSNVAIYYGIGDGTFEQALEAAPGLRNVGDVAIGDVDGDGQLDIAAIAGWENGAIAVLTSSSATATDNSCDFADSDPDGDGWGWENDQSCVVTDRSQPGGTNTGPTPTIHPVCASADSDSDGDGWGWENNTSCRVTNPDSTDTPVCNSASSDPDGDGWGWENNQSCRVANP